MADDQWQPIFQNLTDFYLEASGLSSGQKDSLFQIWLGFLKVVFSGGGLI